MVDKKCSTCRRDYNPSLEQCPYCGGYSFTRAYPSTLPETTEDFIKMFAEKEIE